MDQREKIHINRLRVIKIDKITEDCPKIIIEFLAKSLGLRYRFENTSEWWDRNEKRIITFLESEHSSVMETFDLRDIALFVNPMDDIEWKQKNTLMKSFEHIHSFNPRLPIKNLSFGNKSEKEPLNIDPVMAYQICLHYNIPTSRDTSFKELQNEISLMNRRLTPIRNDIIGSVYRMSREGLISLKRRISSPNIPKSDFFPTEDTREEIISKAREFYRIDISKSNYTAQEYENLERYPLEEYKPFDISFRELYVKNPYYFRLDYRYYPDYNYQNEGLKQRLLFLNGGNIDSETLVLGVHPYCEETSTCIYNNDLEKDIEKRRQIYISTKDFIISREELYDYWDNLYTFNSPLNSSVELSSQHLSMIIRSGEGSLNDLIYKIQGKRKERVDNGYCCLLNNLDISKKFLDHILEIGFLLRGYRVCYDSWPIEESTYDPKYQDEIEIKTGLEIGKHFHNKEFDLLTDKIPVLTGKNILGKDASTCEIKTYDKSSTIKDILVKIVEDVEDINSCMRTNSNYLILTSWYYMNRVFETPPFDIKKIKFVL